MEEGQLQKIQGWFEQLDRKVETLVTKQQFENRFQALLTAITHVRDRLKPYVQQNDEEIRLIKRAPHDIEEELKQLRDSR